VNDAIIAASRCHTLVLVVTFQLASAVAAVVDCVIISLMETRQTTIELC